MRSLLIFPYGKDYLGQRVSVGFLGEVDPLKEVFEIAKCRDADAGIRRRISRRRCGFVLMDGSAVIDAVSRYPVKHCETSGARSTESEAESCSMGRSTNGIASMQRLAHASSKRQRQSLGDLEHN